MSIRGTVDYVDNNYFKLERIIEIIKKNSRTLNLIEMDTPILEYTNTLLNKYGEEAEDKLIFKCKIEKISLRYDLTVPLKRYIEKSNILNLRRLQIGKVFRLDNPEINNGRFREFYQADIDIIGDYNEIETEQSLFWLINKVLGELNIKDYNIKYNYRENLYKIFNLIGINDNIKIKSLALSIDKLDKISYEELKSELRIKELNEEQIDKLEKLLDENYLDEKFKKLNYDNCVFDTKLARGLDYYNGIIFEVIKNNSNIKTIIAGGRYDNFIKNRKGIGLSFGISRILMLMDDVNKNDEKIYLISNNLDKILPILNELRNLKYIVELGNINGKVIKGITKALKNNFTWIIIYGENDDKFKLKKIIDNNFEEKILSNIELINFFT